ncbi:3'-5' exonuclease [Patescibacteria group bacterium]|nr:3'-5' exonuclease [Patescibacteria group bacterium]
MDNIWVSLDVETTGLDPIKDKIIEVALIKYRNEEMIDKYISLIDIGSQLPSNISQLTGISDDDLKKGQKWEVVLEDIYRFMTDVDMVIGHNVEFDKSFLQASGLDFGKRRILDSWYLATLFVWDLGSYSLGNVCCAIGYELKGHRAENDALAVTQVYLYIKKAIKKVSDKLLGRICQLVEKTDWEYKYIFIDEFRERRKENIRVKRGRYFPRTRCRDIGQEYNYANEEYEGGLTILESDLKSVLHQGGCQDNVLIVSKVVFNFLRKKMGRCIYVDQRDKYLCRQRFKEFIGRGRIPKSDIGVIVRIYLVIDRGFWDGYLEDLNLSRNERQVLDRLQCGKTVRCKQDCFFQKKLDSIRNDNCRAVMSFGAWKEEVDWKIRKINFWVDDVLLEDGISNITVEEYGFTKGREILVECARCFQDKNIYKNIVKRLDIVGQMIGLLIKSQGVSRGREIDLGMTPAVLANFAVEDIRMRLGGVITELAANDKGECGVCDNNLKKLVNLTRAIEEKSNKVVKLNLNLRNRKVTIRVFLKNFIDLIENIGDRSDQCKLAARVIQSGKKYYADCLFGKTGVIMKRGLGDALGVEKLYAYSISKVINRLKEYKKSMLILADNKILYDVQRNHDDQNVCCLTSNRLRGNRGALIEKGIIAVTMRNVAELSVVSQGYDCIYLQRLPFDVPGELLTSSRSMYYEDDHFEEYFVQRMVIRVKFVLSLLGNSGILLVGDTRWDDKKYSEKLNTLFVKESIL